MTEPGRTGTLDRSPEPVGALACLGRAGATVREDPVGILLPAGAILLLQVLALATLREAWSGTGAIATVAGLIALRVVGGAVLRSRLIAVGARAAGMDTAPWGRPWALLGVELIVGPSSIAAAALVGLPIGALAVGIAAQGWYTTSAVVFAVAVGLATGAALVVRAVFALAPAEVIVAGRSALAALWHSLNRAPGEILPLVTLVLVGDLLVAVGGLACGAGALPGYPISDLAMLHRWRGAGPGGAA